MSTLYDVPGPAARRRSRVLTGLITAALLALVWWVIQKLDAAGELEWSLWQPFTDMDIWRNFLLPGMLGTLQAFAVGAVLSLGFGLIFAVGRLSPVRPVAWASGAVVEFFRSVPLLLLMVFLWLAPTYLLGTEANVFLAVVVGLMLYNGSVIAEIVRAGVQSLPKGQREAGFAIGLSHGRALRLILLPQALRAMSPAIIAQLVVLLKDSALGYIIGYSELLRQGTSISASASNVIQSMIVVAAMFIAINLTLGRLADRVERRSRLPHRGGDGVRRRATASAAESAGREQELVG